MKPILRYGARGCYVAFVMRVFTPLAILAAGLLALAGCEGPTGPRGAGPGSLTDPSIMPRVVYSYPPAGGEWPFTELYRVDCGDYGYDCVERPAFQLRFNKIMDVPSVRRAVRVSASHGNAGVAPGNIASIGGDIFIVHPVDSNGYVLRGFLAIGERYTLTVDSTAQDVNGNQLAAPFALAFTPEPHFRVVRTTPPDGASLGDHWATLRITFNGRVDSSVLGAVRIAPPVPEPAWFVWWNSNWIQTTIQLRGSTTYTVTVDSTAADVAGHRLSAPFRWSFTSAPFTVTGIYPENGAMNVSHFTNIQIGFSEPIDTATLRRALAFTPPLGYGFYSYDGLGVIVYPRKPLEPSTTYLVTIDSTLMSAAGSRLAGGFLSRFTTGPLPRFAVEYTEPPDGSTDEHSWTLIRVTMNQPVDTASVPGAFILDPPVPGSFVLYSGTNTIVFVPGRQYGMGVTVRVTVDSTLRSVTGHALGEQYRFSFTTRRLAVTSVLPPDGRTDVAPSYPLTVGFTGTIDTGSLAGAFRFDPPAPGSFTSDRYQVRFVPANGWIPETTYTIRIDTTLAAEGGGRLLAPFTSTFRTAPFRVLQYSPPDGVVNVPVNYHVMVYCNDAVDTVSVRSSFAMTDSAGSAVEGWFEFWDTYPVQFGFHPSWLLAPGTRYTVSITTGFRSAHGYAIKSPLVFSFRTAP
ncbi:MAG TPA: Ig-like domain-containing protein [Bacteroidota bacterium]|nr:Ig-like domain-containing protein [Bacteroidota bacterium]